MILVNVANGHFRHLSDGCDRAPVDPVFPQQRFGRGQDAGARFPASPLLRFQPGRGQAAVDVRHASPRLNGDDLS
jgi:hypothetical protein